MKQQLTRYARRLADEGCVRPDRVALACRNDLICAVGPDDLAELATAVLKHVPATAVVVAEPMTACAQLLLQRTAPHQTAIVPRDSESRSSLHDIPLVRPQHDQAALAAQVATSLTRRKGCIVQGYGLIAQGALTVEQSYINWSSLHHATTIKYLEDLLQYGPQLPSERQFCLQLAAQGNQQDMSLDYSHVHPGPLTSTAQITAELARVGSIMVRAGLVDSFFGNISYAGDDGLYISQTSARLDELAHQLDLIPFDGTSTAGITASSELPAHRAIVAATGCRAVLHGHPRFPVALSFFAGPSSHEDIEQIAGIPVVEGEGGQGGLAQSVPRALTLTGAPAVIVKGHGVFSVGRHGFREALAAMIATERSCRQEYVQRMKQVGVSV